MEKLETQPKEMYLALQIPTDMFVAASAAAEPQLPENIEVEKHPHITIIKPTKSSIVESSLERKLFAEFENKNIISNKIYAFYNKDRNRTYFCVGFSFESPEDEKRFFEIRRSFYGENNIPSDQTAIQLHLTLGEAVGDFVFPDIDVQKNFTLPFILKRKIKGGDFLG